MAGERQLPDEERQRVTRRVRELRRGATSWADLARTLNAFASNRGEEVGGESLRKAGDLGQAGLKIQRLIDRHDAGAAPSARTVERDERYQHVVEIELADAAAGGVSDAICAAARVRLVGFKGEPTAEDVRAAINEARRAAREARERYADDPLERAPVLPTRKK